MSDFLDIRQVLKQVHRAANREAAELKLNEFTNNWHQTYPKLIKDLLKMPNLLTFMDFPPAIRQSLYSTNLIENFNKHLKRTTHHKEQFPNETTTILIRLKLGILILKNFFKIHLIKTTNENKNSANIVITDIS
nr:MULTISPECIES: transposase [Lactiplantibacillus]